MSKHKTLPQLRRRLLKAAEIMVQGGLSETTRRCGNPGCICQRDPSQRHGPHLYLTYQSEGKNRALYVPAKHVEDARQAHAAWKEFLGAGLCDGRREPRAVASQDEGQKADGHTEARRWLNCDSTNGRCGRDGFPKKRRGGGKSG